MLIDRIDNARVAGHDGLVDITMAHGAITTIVPGRGIRGGVTPYPYGYNGATWGPVEIRRR